MQFRETSIPGCFEVHPQIREDHRGRFIKTFHEDVFSRHALQTEFREVFYSVSRKDVLRGLHFQTPPDDHEKMVYCVDGAVFDAVVDLRKGSPTYGRSVTFTLSAELGNQIYIPSGLAHGFLVLSDQATTVYHVSTVHSPEHDTGVRWDSVGIPWPIKAPIISERDANLVAFPDFDTPFVYQAE